MTPDREKVIEALHCRAYDDDLPCSICAYYRPNEKPVAKCDYRGLMDDAIALLKEQESLLGIQQTADSITFISTGTAQQGENRGLLLGKYAMHEWLEKELLYRGLLTDDIRAVFDEAKRQEGR